MPDDAARTSRDPDVLSAGFNGAEVRDVAEFDRYLKQDADIGRTLDFLSQEMLREINTIGSNSSDVETARAVVALKSDTERLKEQAANLE